MVVGRRVHLSQTGIVLVLFRNTLQFVALIVRELFSQALEFVWPIIYLAGSLKSGLRDMLARTVWKGDTHSMKL